MDELLIINIVIAVSFAVLGGCFGSFANVVALRRAENESFTTGRSRCSKCGGTLRWFELIPVISWLIQAGRCRRCKARISVRYLLVDLTGATAAALCFIRYGLTWNTLIASGVMVILLLIGLIDLTVMEIPDGLVIALIPFAIAAIWTQPEITLISRGIGLLAVSLPMLVLAIIIQSAFGGGDVKLMFICGFLLGWQNTLLAFFIAVVIAGCVALSLIMQKKAKKGAKLAFGPYLCVGTMTALLYGNNIISWYLGLYGF